MTEQDRLLAAMPRVVETLHGLARELDLTNDELMAVLGFLGEVGAAGELVLLSDVVGLSRLVDDQTHAGAGGTSSNVLGPFYLEGAPWIDNPGSIVDPADPTDPAGRIVIRGRIVSAGSGVPLADAVIDVWQANADGVYSNEDPALPPWNLRGRLRTDADGRYEVATVPPKHYTVKHDGPVGRLLETLGRHPWRPAHIHLLVTADGHAPLVTQVYIAGGPYLDDDTIDGVKSELIVPVVDRSIRFDIELAPEPARVGSHPTGVASGPTPR